MSTAFNVFENRERYFNALFSTIVAIAISTGVGGLLAEAGVFRTSDSWFIFIILIGIPIITFLVADNEAEFRTAYYKSWCDMLYGWYDSRKVMKGFWRQYAIPKRRRRVGKFRADKRWNYHIETNYMEKLLNQRELLLDKMFFEYSVLLRRRIEVAKKAEHDLKEANIRLEYIEEIKGYTKALLDRAKSSGEVYKQRQDYRSVNRDVTQDKLLRNDAESKLVLAKKQIIGVYDCYKNDVYKVERVFNARYDKYLGQVTRKICRIEGLKYTTSMMPNMDTWLKKLGKDEYDTNKN